MGLPMVQVFMIIARQMSKPVADLVMRYGKKHPLFRNKILIPVGRGLVNLTTRLRMKNLGLGVPTSIAPVSESASLEQASEFVQQVVIFGYTLTVLYAYQTYSKLHDVQSITKDDLKQTQNEFNSKILMLNSQIDSMQSELEQLRAKTSSRWTLWPFFSSSKPTKSKFHERRQSAPPTSTISRTEAMRMISPTFNDST